MTECPQGPGSPLLILVSAPSGAGKTTLCSRLLECCPNLSRIITCTTRPARDGERDGIDYFFLTPVAFRRRIEAGDFLEHATVHGHAYGTLRSEVLGLLDRGRDALLNIDVQGHSSIRREAAGSPRLRQALVTIFLTTPSIEALEQRLRNRASDSDEVIQRRLAVARGEVARWREFDYLLISDTIDEDLRRARVILEAEHLRHFRSNPPHFGIAPPPHAS